MQRSHDRTEMMILERIPRSVNGVVIDQRVTDGFINATTLCAAYGKKLRDWLQMEPTFKLFVALAKRLGSETKENFKLNSSMAMLSRIFPDLIVVKRGSPENGGGIWIHPKLAIQLAYWCEPEFALQVLDWVEEWLLFGQKPTMSHLMSSPLPPTLLLQVLKARIRDGQELNRRTHKWIHQMTDVLRDAEEITAECEKLIAHEDSLISEARKAPTFPNIPKKIVKKSIILGRPTHQTGSIYRYTTPREIKEGIVEYPRVNGRRDPNNPNHWYWGLSYVVWKNNRWQDRSKSFPRRLLLQVQEAIARNVSLDELLTLIEPNLKVVS